MHLFNKCCVFPVSHHSCCYPQQTYGLYSQCGQGQFQYGRQPLPYGQPTGFPTQLPTPVMENLPSRRSKG